MIKNHQIDPNAAIDPSKILGGLGAPLRADAKFFYVDSNNGSKSFTGETPARAKATIQGAVTAARA